MVKVIPVTQLVKELQDGKTKSAEDVVTASKLIFSLLRSRNSYNTILQSKRKEIPILLLSLLTFL